MGKLALSVVKTAAGDCRYVGVPAVAAAGRWRHRRRDLAAVLKTFSAAKAMALGHLRHVPNAFLRHHHDQGLTSRLISADDLFHASTYETVKV